jgi:hypothetical protein
MLARLVIFASLAAACLAGDTRDSGREFDRLWRLEEQRHKKLAAQPTPSEWRAGAVWRFVTTAPPGKPQPPIITVRVTAEPAQSCSAEVFWKNDWRKLVLVGDKAPLPPIYQVEGRALQIGVAGEICDMYDDINGVLTEGEFKGRRSTSGLGASTEFIGTVAGSIVQP